MIDKKIIKPFAYEIYKKSFQEIDEKTKENTFFLKNKLIVDYYFYEVFNTNIWLMILCIYYKSLTYIILIARFGMV